MPAGRRTRSGRAAPVAPMKRIRTKGGCLTCRIRRKKCDESRDHGNGGCETCARLHIECLGYSNKRPEWLKGSRVDDYKRKIKHFLADHNAKSSSRGHDDAFLHLHHLRESEAPPRHHSESAHSDSDSDASSCVDMKFQESSPAFVLPSPPMALEIPTWTWPYDPSPVDLYGQWPQGGLYDSYGSEDAEGSPVSEESAFGLPVLVDSTLSDNMQNNSIEQYVFPSPIDPSLIPPLGAQPSFQLVVSPYEQPAVDPNSLNIQPELWSSYLASFRWLPLAAEGHSMESSLYGGDPLGAMAVSEALGNGNSPHNLPTEQLAELTTRRRRALQHLRSSGYNKAEARAVSSMWMMTGSLCQGAFECWGDCLDFVLRWMSERLPATSITSGSSALSSLVGTEQALFSRGLWSDLVASATTGRVPCCIDLYRRILSSADVEVLECPNKVTLAFAEVACVAAHPDHIPQARKKLDRLREDLQVSDGSERQANIKAQIHTAGVRLYLETVASRGTVDSPAVQNAVRNVCQLVSNTDESRRDFAFWIFLAGCHAMHRDQWSNCQMMIDGMKAEGQDMALEVASDIMNKAYVAREGGNTSPSLWAEQMRQCRALLI